MLACMAHLDLLEPLAQLDHQAHLDQLAMMVFQAQLVQRDDLVHLALPDILV